MVFIFVPPLKGGHKSSRREAVIGFFIAAMIALGFAILVVFLGPKGASPPPPIVKWVLVGIAVIFAFVGFFTWLRHAGDADDAGQDNNSQEKQ